MAKCIKTDVLKYEVGINLDLLIFTAHSDSESEASYASVPRKESTDSGHSANNR